MLEPAGPKCHQVRVFLSGCTRQLIHQCVRRDKPCLGLPWQTSRHCFRAHLKTSHEKFCTATRRSASIEIWFASTPVGPWKKTIGKGLPPALRAKAPSFTHRYSRKEAFCADVPRRHLRLPRKPRIAICMHPRFVKSAGEWWRFEQMFVRQKAISAGYV